jgi:hypothetical protein
VHWGSNALRSEVPKLWEMNRKGSQRMHAWTTEAEANRKRNKSLASCELYNAASTLQLPTVWRRLAIKLTYKMVGDKTSRRSEHRKVASFRSSRTTLASEMPLLFSQIVPHLRHLPTLLHMRTLSYSMVVTGLAVSC